MTTSIFINLPVKDLAKTKAFFAALGFTFNPQFTDENAACMVIEENIFAMLLTYPHFERFTKKPIADANKTTEVILALARDSRSDVDAMVQVAVAAGGTLYADPQDHAFMYQHGFQDPDGHIWEVFWMDPAHLEQADA